MDPSVHDWLNLILRWIHIVTAIAWVGTSFFFNWLDAVVRRPRETKEGVEKELWMVHSGGFYELRRMNRVRPEKPRPLGDEAQATWISGMLLLILIYYVSANAYLIDPNGPDLGVGPTIAIGLGMIGLSWLVYDGLWRSPLARRPALAIALSSALLLGVGYAMTEVMSGRAAFIHVGAMLGTLMWANVRVHILPVQRRLIAETGPGEPPDAALTAIAKRRSLHNNYMTLPVVLVMISNHFPVLYAHRYNWLVLFGLFVIGAGVRHAFNLKNREKLRGWMLPAAAVATAALIAATLPRSEAPRRAGADEGGAVPFAEIRLIVAERCASCHSETPSNEDFDVAPKDVRLDTPSQIRALAARIRTVAVQADTMPLGNLTGMTEAERARLGRWIDQGARIR